MTRSGDTPKAILGGTTGTLVVDMYTGYNAITGVEGRQRAGCLSHARRKFFKALNSAPEAQVALELIRDIYVIERDVKIARETGEVDHARARWEQCLPIMDKLYVWLAKQKTQHPPKSVMGNAINYTLKNWQALTRFITNTEIPPDNNRSERALRAVALGRNYAESRIMRSSLGGARAAPDILATGVERRSRIIRARPRRREAGPRARTVRLATWDPRACSGHAFS